MNKFFSRRLRLWFVPLLVLLSVFLFVGCLPGEEAAARSGDDDDDDHDDDDYEQRTPSDVRPDLAVDIIDFNSNYGGTGIAKITIFVNNKGLSPTGDFTLWFWAHRDFPPDTNSDTENPQIHEVVGGLNAGGMDSYILEAPDEHWTTGSQYTAYALADGKDLIDEVEEGNNMGFLRWTAE